MGELGNHKDLPEFLGQCVGKIKKNYPWMSSLALAKKLDIPNSTFDRISKREVKTPFFSHALKIVQEACGSGNIQAFIKKFYPNMMEDFIKAYPGNNNVPFVDPSIEVFFQNPTSFEIMMMASSEVGVTKKKVLEEYGRKGLAILDEMLERGVFKTEEDKYFIEGKINARQETVHKLLQNLVSLSYNLNDFGSQQNWLSLQYDSVNLDKVLPKMREIYIKANQEIRELLKSPESRGNSIIWAGLVMDRLIKSESPQGDQDKGLVQ